MNPFLLGPLPQQEDEKERVAGLQTYDRFQRLVTDCTALAPFRLFRMHDAGRGPDTGHEIRSLDTEACLGEISVVKHRESQAV